MESWEITNERERSVDRFTISVLQYIAAFPEYMHCPTPRFHILAISDVMHSNRVRSASARSLTSFRVARLIISIYNLQGVAFSAHA